MNKNKLYIKEWIESVSCEKRKPSMKYNGTINSSTKIHYSVLCMDLIFCPRFPNYWNWISPYSLIRYPCFSRRQDQTRYMYSNFSCKIWVFFFLNTSHPSPVDNRTFATFSGFSQIFYYLIGGSTSRSMGLFLSLD